MAKEKDPEDVLRELDPDYDKVIKSLPKLEVGAEAKDGKQAEDQGVDQERLLYNLVGGAAGAGVASSTQKALEKEIDRRITRELQGRTGPGSVFGEAARRSAGPSLPTQMPSQAPASPDMERVARILQGSTEEGISGRARATGFNVQTAQEAAAQRQMAQTIEEMRRRGIVGRTAQDVFASLPGMTATQSGVLTPRAEAPTLAGPRPVQPPMGPPVPPTAVGYTQAPPQQPGALQRAGQAVGTGARVAGGAAMDLLSSPRIAGAAGGIGVSEGLQQYYSRREQDPLGAGLALMSAGAGGLSTLPILPMNLRVGLGVASPLTMYLYDKLRPYQSVLERPAQQ